MKLQLLTLAILLGYGTCDLQIPEPVCSKYEYDVRILERVLKFELVIDGFKEKMQAWETAMTLSVESVKTVDREINKRLEKADKNLQKSLETSIDASTVRISELESRLIRSMAEWNRTINKYTEMMAKVESNLNKTMDSFIQRQSAVNDALGVQVGFSVHTPTGNLIGTVPAFKTTIVNVGGGYKSNGLFTCPISGMYHFDLSIRSASGSSSTPYCWIRKNGKSLVFADTDADTYDSASVAVNVVLAKNDIVDLNCKNWQRARQSAATSFSGVLLTPDF